MGKTEVPLLRTSERKDFKRCPWLWQETWMKGRGTLRVPVWSWFGTAIHYGLEIRYPVGTKRGSVTDMLDAFEESVGKETGRIWQDNPNVEIDEEEVVDAIELGKAMLIGYVGEYGKDTEWEVINSEQAFQIRVPDPNDSSRDLVTYAGRWDGLWRNRISKLFYVVDHKTRKSFPQNWQFYNIDDQAGSYLWVAPEVLRHLGVFGKKDQIEGLIFNALKKHMPDTRPRDDQGRARNKPQKAHYEAALSDAGVSSPSRTTIAELHSLATSAGLTVLGDVSAVQPAALFHREVVYRSQSERVTQGQRVQQEALAMDDVRSGRRKAFKVPTEDCVRCKIFEYCEADENAKEEGKEMRKILLTRRDYYGDHREAMQANGVNV